MQCSNLAGGSSLWFACRWLIRYQHREIHPWLEATECTQTSVRGSSGSCCPATWTHTHTWTHAYMHTHVQAHIDMQSCFHHLWRHYIDFQSFPGDFLTLTINTTTTCLSLSRNLSLSLNLNLTLNCTQDFTGIFNDFHYRDFHFVPLRKVSPHNVTVETDLWPHNVSYTHTHCI